MKLIDALREAVREVHGPDALAAEIPAFRECTDHEVQEMVANFVHSALMDPLTANPVGIALGAFTIGVMVGRKTPETVQ
jgi:hypothetical protein